MDEHCILLEEKAMILRRVSATLRVCGLGQRQLNISVKHRKASARAASGSWILDELVIQNGCAQFKTIDDNQ